MSIDYSRKILENIKFTSDGVSEENCYKLCAKKENLEFLFQENHHVIWGRRGTGKTTLLKAFVYYVNCIKEGQDKIAHYMLMKVLL